MAALVPDITGFLEQLNQIQTGSNWQLASGAGQLGGQLAMDTQAGADAVGATGGQYQAGIDAAYQNALGEWQNVPGAGVNPGLAVLQQQAQNQRDLTGSLQSSWSQRMGQQSGLPQQIGDAALSRNNAQFDEARALALKQQEQLNADGGSGGGGGFSDGFGGGGGGGRRGRGGGGGGGGGEDLSAQQTTDISQLLEPNVDYRLNAMSRKGSFGNQGKPPKKAVKGGAYGKGAQDFLFGQEGGAKGHVSPDLSNIDQVLQKQLAWIDKTRSKGGKVGYTKGNLIKLANDVKAKVGDAQKELRNRSVAFNRLDLNNLIGDVFGEMAHPQDQAKLEAAAASNPGPSAQQQQAAAAKWFAAAKKADEQKWTQAVQANKTAAQAASGNMMPGRGPSQADINKLRVAQQRNNQGVSSQGQSYFSRNPAAFAAYLNRNKQYHPRGYAGRRPGPG